MLGGGRGTGGSRSGWQAENLISTGKTIGSHGRHWSRRVATWLLWEEESGSSSKRRQAWKKQAHPHTIRSPLPEVHGVSLSTIGRERTTSSLQPGQGDKGVRTGSCLKELRSEQPGPRPPPQPCAGRSGRGGCQGEEAIRPKCSGPAALASRGALGASVLLPTGLSFPTLEVLGVPVLTQSLKRPPPHLLGTRGVGPGACPRGQLQTVHSGSSGLDEALRATGALLA